MLSPLFKRSKVVHILSGNRHALRSLQIERDPLHGKWLQPAVIPDRARPPSSAPQANETADGDSQPFCSKKAYFNPHQLKLGIALRNY